MQEAVKATLPPMAGEAGEAVMVQGLGFCVDTVASPCCVKVRVVGVPDGNERVDPAGTPVVVPAGMAVWVPLDWVRVAAEGTVTVVAALKVATEPAGIVSVPPAGMELATGVGAVAGAAELPDAGQAKENPPEMEKLAPTPRSLLAWKTVNMTVFTMSQAERMTAIPMREAKMPFLAVSMVLWLPEETIYRTPMAVMTARAMKTMMFRMYPMREATPETM